MKRLRFFTNFIVPVFAIIMAFQWHPGLGVLGISLFLMYLIRIGKPKLFAYLGSVQFAQGEHEQALFWYEKANASSGIAPNQRIGYGYLLLKQGELMRAEQVINSVLKQKLTRDEHMTARSNYAILQWKQGNLDGAITTLEDVLADYKHTTVYGSLGFFYIEKGDLEKALSFNREAYEFNDSAPSILDNYGLCLYLNGDMTEAAAIFEQAIEHKPKFPEVYYHYGITLLALEKWDEARKFLQKSLEIPPSMIHAVTEELVEEKLRELDAKIAASSS